MTAPLVSPTTGEPVSVVARRNRLGRVVQVDIESSRIDFGLVDTSPASHVAAAKADAGQGKPKSGGKPQATVTRPAAAGKKKSGANTGGKGR